LGFSPNLQQPDGLEMFLGFFVNKENNEPRFAYGQARINDF
jgi:hypothetical protein